MTGATVSDRETEPSVTEIAVALREARRGANRLLAFPPTPERPGSERLGSERPLVADGPDAAPSDPEDAAALRTAEYRRLVAENARLNDRIAVLLDRLAEAQARAEGALRAEAARVAETVREIDARSADREAVATAVQEALQAELRPVLAALLQVLERQRRDAGSRAPPAPVADQAIVDLDAPDA